MAASRWHRGPRTSLPRPKQLIFIFLTGGFSHVDTFDPKPKLTDDHGKTVSAESLRDVTNAAAAGLAVQVLAGRAKRAA